MPHFVQCKSRMQAGLHGAAILGMDHPAADQPLDAIRLQIGAGQYGDHARYSESCLCVDFLDDGVRIGAAYEGRVGLSRFRQIVRIVALAGDKAEIFFPFDGCPDERSHMDAFRSAAKTVVELRRTSQDLRHAAASYGTFICCLVRYALSTVAAPVERGTDGP